ncbi:SDR family NAD(P)-dependent oxidoreductase [Amycolatopsis sp. SID8362]|uniref:SDR family NAD(P)-dependent oxidoreductase n=1 Tax=Amycolatopsis sp. SID8362 TaxID=2690346 RepID=UPI0035C919A0
MGALEEQEESDYRRQFEVNFFGAVALTRLVLPGMRQRGTIVNVSSMDGLAGLPANGYYSAGKFALEGFTEALWQEIEPLGLRALIVQPGSFRTGIEHRTKAHRGTCPASDRSSSSGTRLRSPRSLRSARRKTPPAPPK